jgi:hypothetical protein
MWPAVLAALKPALKAEGLCPWMYLDSAALVTTGMGNKLATLSDAQKIGWTDLAGNPASADAIAAEWNNVTSRTDLIPQGGGAFASVTSLRLSDQTIDDLILRGTRVFEAMWKARFPSSVVADFDAAQGATATYSSDFTTFNADLQLALLRWAWGNGSHVFPKMFKAIDAGDFLTAGAESHWKNEAPETADLLKQLFVNAAVSQAQALDPSAMIFPSSPSPEAVAALGSLPSMAGDTVVHTLDEVNTLAKNYDMVLGALQQNFDRVKVSWGVVGDGAAIDFSSDLDALEQRWQYAHALQASNSWVTSEALQHLPTAFVAGLAALFSGADKTQAIPADVLYRSYLGAILQGSLARDASGEYVGDGAPVQKGDVFDLVARLSAADKALGQALPAFAPMTQPSPELGSMFLKSTNWNPTPTDWEHYFKLTLVAITAGVVLMGLNTVVAAKREFLPSHA